MNEPIGIDFCRELLLASKNAGPLELSITGRTISWRSRSFDGNHAAPNPGFGDRCGSIGRAVIDEVDLDALAVQVVENMLEYIRFVEGGNQRDYSERPGAHVRFASVRMRRNSAVA